MLSVFLHVRENGSALLAKTLENLVPFAVDGFIQEVTLTYRELDEVTLALADEAGCNLSKSTQKFEDICAEARGDWLLFMQAGSTLQAGWPQVVLAHARAGGGAASFRLAVSPDVPWWKRVFAPVTHKSPLAKGFLISKRHAQANANGKSNVENMMRGLAIKPLSVGITSA